jgi:hypothetical protein
MPLLWRVHHAELAYDLAIEVTQQRERQIELFGKRGVSAATLDAKSEYLGSQFYETRVVLTEPL